MLRRALPLVLLACALLPARAAQDPAVRLLPDDLRVGLIPLDSRPATSSLPARVGAVGGLDVLVPPVELLGDLRRGADADALYRWLDEADPPALVASLDALAYGGLVQSRRADLGLEEAWARLRGLRVWQERTGRMVLGFLTIPRYPDARDRARNLALARRALGWAADGTLARLTIAWDDALPGSPAPAEGAVLRAEADALGLGATVLVGPGADEVASTLLARYRLDLEGLAPRVGIVFSNPAASGRVVPYDGLPLDESARRQARAAGLEVSDVNPDLRLFVYNGGPTRAAALDLLFLARQGPVALADVERVNLASAPLVEDLVRSGGFLGLRAFAAWGTPGNNLGTALAQAAMRLARGPSAAQSALLVREYVNDYLYSTLVRPQVRAAWTEARLSGEDADEDLVRRLREALRASPGLGEAWTLERADFPWDRSFEVRLGLARRPSACVPPRPCPLP